jgi:heavy metal sensor kinase
MSRLPIRVRLTLAFGVAMAVVLAGTGAFLYVRLGDSLEEQIETSLDARAATLVALARSRDIESRLEGSDETFGQVIAADGTILAASPGIEAVQLLSPGDVAGAREGPVTSSSVVRPVDEDEDVAVRLLAVPADHGRVVVAAESLEDRDEALGGLAAQLLLGGPIALLLASAAGYLLAGAALRPVEAMRRRASEISADTPEARLPLPQARDEVFRLGETLNDMLARLEAGIRRERQFVADASHELRTPLALLKTELDLALRRPRSVDELQEALRSAAVETDRLVRLAESLLVLARSDEGRLPLHESTFEVGPLLEAVAGRFEARTVEAGRRLEVDPAPGASLIGDRLRLEQALENLVDNALRHGGGTIRVAALTDNGSLLLRVSDEGPGFPAGFAPHAFERFTRADSARGRGGTGLGLAIVDTIARAHDGRAFAGEGATVTIVLPGRGIAPADRPL